MLRLGRPRPEVARWPSRRVRRLLDVVIASVALVLASPVLLVLAVVIVVTMGRPVLYWHERAGQDGKPFRMVKLRSMRPEYDRRGRFVEDIDRITPLGRFMRRTSLDEIPELLNVLRGEMSMVGPRPLLMEYLDRYTDEQALRLRVRPGVTGLAQVSGRNAISWDDRFALDVEYVRTASPRLDAKILWRTAAQVVRRDGVVSEGYASVPKYVGMKDGKAQVAAPRPGETGPGSSSA